MRLARTSPACENTRMCSLRVGWLTPSFRADSDPHTPSLTRSPSTCGGKWARGVLQPLEDLQPALIGERPQRIGDRHIAN